MMASSVREAYAAVRSVAKFAQSFAVLETALEGVANLDAIKDELTATVAKQREERDALSVGLANVKAEAERRNVAAIAQADRLVADAHREAEKIVAAAKLAARSVEEAAAKRVMALDADVADRASHADALTASLLHLSAERDALAREIESLKNRLRPLVG